jgi:FkbM family methyltransferase
MKVTFEERRGLTFICREGTVDIHEVDGLDWWPLQHALAKAEHSQCGIESGVCVDVGAHIGTFTVRYKDRYPKSKVIAIEPCKESFQLLQKNIELNRVDMVIPLQAALGSIIGPRYLYSSKENWMHSVVKINTNISSEKETVIGMYLGWLVEIFQLNRISFLKLNCEGAEFEILECIEEDFLRKIDAIYAELHYDCIEVSIERRNGIYTKLIESGMSVELIRSNVDIGENKKEWLVATRRVERRFPTGHLNDNFTINSLWRGWNEI